MTTLAPTIDFEPVGRRITAQPDETLLGAAQRAGIGLVALCGGAGTCGRCIVQVRAGELTPPTEVETKKLKPGQLEQGFRLACQARPLGNVRLHVPPTSLTATQRAQIEGQERSIEFDPPVRVLRVQLPIPTLEDPRSDTRRLRDVCAAQLGEPVAGEVDFMLARDLTAILRGADLRSNDFSRSAPDATRSNDFSRSPAATPWHIKVTLRSGPAGWEIVAVMPANQLAVGLAVDLGTTKLAGYLVNMETGETLAAKGLMNPQISYGEDVMARITYAMEGADKARQLRDVIVKGLADQAQELCAGAGVSPAQIVEAVIVGNTAMHHLFLGLAVEQLGTSPYVAAVSEALDVKARDIGFAFAPGAYVHLLPNIAGFVGADHVAMLLSTGIGEAPADEVWIGMDIGTNTEIGLSARGRLLCCSTASGPAFEGAHIQYGMRAAPGAIEEIKIEGGQVQIYTIDNKPAIGICGSGILDAVAELYDAGILNKRGAMADAPGVRPARTGRGKEFLLVPAEQTAIGEDISVSRQDVSEIQLAKGAMRAGLNILLEEAGLTAQDITRFIIAGAFGSYIKLDSGVTIGMLPDIPRERFAQVGNAAGIGAKQALVSLERRRAAAAIAAKDEYVELTANNRFSNEFPLTSQLGIM